ncbi:MAG: hypothetical protein ACREC5_01825 [Thermoplasmata archaeon]
MAFAINPELAGLVEHGREVPVAVWQPGEVLEEPQPLLGWPSWRSTGATVRTTGGQSGASL